MDAAYGLILNVLCASSNMEGNLKEIYWLPERRPIQENDFDLSITKIIFPKERVS